MSRGLLQAIVEALMLARAHPEAIKAAVAAYEAWERTKRPVGRQRKYADTPARRRAYNEQRRKKPVGTGGGPDEARPRYDTGSDSLRYDLRVRLIDASNGNIDPLADIAPIRALLAQGCDLELNVLPIVAREVPELPRPLKNWGAPWLVADQVVGPPLEHVGRRGGSCTYSAGPVLGLPPIWLTRTRARLPRRRPVSKVSLT